MATKLKNSLLLLTLSFSIAQPAALPAVAQRGAPQAGAEMSFSNWVDTLGEDLNAIRQNMPVVQLGEQCDRYENGAIVEPNGNHQTCWLHMIFQAALVRAIAESNQEFIAQLLELQFSEQVQSDFLRYITNPANFVGAENRDIRDNFNQTHNVLVKAQELLTAHDNHIIPDGPILFIKWLAENKPADFFDLSTNSPLFNYVLDTYRAQNCPCVITPFFGFHATFDQFFFPQVFETQALSEVLRQLVARERYSVTVNVLLGGHWATLVIFRNSVGTISYVWFDSLFALPGGANLKGASIGDKAKVTAACLAEIQRIIDQPRGEGQPIIQIDRTGQHLPQAAKDLIERTRVYLSGLSGGSAAALGAVQAFEQERVRQLELARQAAADAALARQLQAEEEQDQRARFIQGESDRFLALRIFYESELERIRQEQLVHQAQADAMLARRIIERENRVYERQQQQAREDEVAAQRLQADDVRAEQERLAQLQRDEVLARQLAQGDDGPVAAEAMAGRPASPFARPASPAPSVASARGWGPWLRSWVGL